jgi:arsenate reductase-like glutaredoxin family protein
MKVKDEIIQLVDELPDEFLNELRDFIRELNRSSKEESHLTLNLKKIVLEDQNLLRRLAQ